MIRTSLVCSALAAGFAATLSAGLVLGQTPAGGVSQIAPPSTPSVGADQISPPIASATPAQQVSPRSAGANPAPQQLSPRSAGIGAPVSISPREAGRNVAAAPVEGHDRCDPAARSAASSACADILDNRADDFEKPPASSQTATVDTAKSASGLVDDILKNGTGTVVSLPPTP